MILKKSLWGEELFGVKGVLSGACSKRQMVFMCIRSGAVKSA